MKTTPWCTVCNQNHEPNSDCVGVADQLTPGFLQLPMPSDLYFDFKGWRFKPPFHCMCCGKLIHWQQWSFGRSCGTCDTGKCGHTRHMPDAIYSGPAELIDKGEADKFRFVSDRFVRIDLGEKPEDWSENNKS